MCFESLFIGCPSCFGVRSQFVSPKRIISLPSLSRIERTFSSLLKVPTGSLGGLYHARTRNVPPALIYSNLCEKLQNLNFPKLLNMSSKLLLGNLGSPGISSKGLRLGEPRFHEFQYAPRTVMITGEHQVSLILKPSFHRNYCGWHADALNAVPDISRGKDRDNSITRGA